jgi:hypothetical protein
MTTAGDLLIELSPMDCVRQHAANGGILTLLRHCASSERST